MNTTTISTAETDGPPKPTLIRYAVGLTSLGHTFLAMSERGLCGLYLLDDADPSLGLARMRAEFPHAELIEDDQAIAPVIERLRAYLDTGCTCDDLPLDLHGTPFQMRVWNALRSIPRGATRTYGALAQELGLPLGAARSVGTACGANPISILVPCHRVLRSDGSLGGYSGGLDRKRALLDLESRQQSLAL